MLVIISRVSSSWMKSMLLVDVDSPRERLQTEKSNVLSWRSVSRSREEENSLGTQVHSLERELPRLTCLCFLRSPCVHVYRNSVSLSSTPLFMFMVLFSWGGRGVCGCQRSSSVMMIEGKGLAHPYLANDRRPCGLSIGTIDARTFLYVR